MKYKVDPNLYAWHPSDGLPYGVTDQDGQEVARFVLRWDADLFVLEHNKKIERADTSLPK